HHRDLDSFPTRRSSDLSTSHSSFEKVKKYLEKSGYVDGTHFNSIKAKGQERIELYESGGVIQFRTRTSSGGLGEGFDLLVIDERSEEHTSELQSRFDLV